MTADSYHMPDQILMYCPACQGDLTLSKHESGDVRPPRAGDHTVCGHHPCYTFLRYVEPEPGQLRLDVIQREEFEALPERAQSALLQVRGELQSAYRANQPTRYEAALALELTALKQRVSMLESGACHCMYCRGGDGFNCTHRRYA